MRNRALIRLVLAAVLTPAACGAGPQEQVTFLRTLAPPEAGIEGLETAFVPVTVDAGQPIGPMPPIQGDLSQGAETGDPLFFEEMEHLLAELHPQLVRVEPFAAIGSALSLDADGALSIDFSRADRIVSSLRRTGARICWNCSCWPKQWSEGHNRFPRDLAVWESFIRQVVEHYNGRGERRIEYIEFWNEPSSFGARHYDVLARTATKVDPGVKVGAPAVMDLNLRVIEQAVKHCHESGTPLDFISFHLYYKPPWEWPELIAKAQAVLDKYPGMEALEMLVTEWGIDAGESGTCDTRFNAAYYSSVLERVIPYWPRVRPTHFELREGWDWKGPSRDLFGRWGMLTYSNLLPKPVFQAARMWARMAGTRVQCHSGDDRIRVIAAVAPEKLTILLWSYPREYQRLQAVAPEHGPSVLDIPVQLDVVGIAFGSPGLSYERYALDHLHSNVATDYGRSALEKVQAVVLARHGADDAFRVQTVMPLHGVSLIVLRPAERAPADVEATADRYQIWAGQSAEVTIRPKFGEDFPLELLAARGSPDSWRIEVLSANPLRLRAAPARPEVRGQQFFTAWVKRSDWRAIGRALVEFRTDLPIVTERPSWRIDLASRTRSGDVRIPLRSRAHTGVSVRARWSAQAPLNVDPSISEVSVPALGSAVASATASLPPDAAPGKYTLSTILNTGVDLEPLETTVYLPMPSYCSATPPTLDGKLDEWRDLPPLIITGKGNWGGHHASRWDGPADLSGKAWSRWNSHNLYFAFEVTDDVHYAPVASQDMRKYDCVHIGFDLRRDALDRREFFIEDDCHYGITLTDRGVAYRFWGAKRREETPKEVIVAATRSGTLTTYEVAFPWTAEFEPYAGPDTGRVIGLTILFRDIDPDEEQGFLHWGGGLPWHEIRPALFYSMELVKP